MSRGRSERRARQKNYNFSDQLKALQASVSFTNTTIKTQQFWFSLETCLEKKGVGGWNQFFPKTSLEALDCRLLYKLIKKSRRRDISLKSKNASEAYHIIQNSFSSPSFFEVMKYDADATSVYCTNHKEDNSVFAFRLDLHMHGNKLCRMISKWQSTIHMR